MEPAGLIPTTENQVRALEHRAARAWPPETVRDLDGWMLRRTAQAGSRRVNSVRPEIWHRTLTFDDMIGAAEAFYRDVGKLPRFQVTSLAAPDDLDGRLEARNYEIEAPVRVQGAPLTTFARVADANVDIAVSPTVTKDWANVMAQGAKSAEDVTDRIQTINRIRPLRTLVCAYVSAEPVSIGLGVYDDGWCGIFSMQTLPAFRRQGLANSVLGSLADWARKQGGNFLYLQVEENNPAAIAFYQRRGFETVYHYHYRTFFGAGTPNRR